MAQHGRARDDRPGAPGPRDRARDDRGDRRARSTRHESPSRILEDVVWRHRALKVAPKTVNQKRYVDAIRNAHDHGRHRPGRHRQVVPGRRDGGRGAVPARGQPHRAHPPRGRGRRAARLPARRPDGEGRSVPAPAVRRALRHARARARQPAPRARRDRGRAAGVHARPHAERRVHHPRRGPEHDARADEDVPHAARLQLEDGRDRRHHADRPAARPALGARGDRRHPRRASRASSSSASAARTWCATSSCSASSPPTTSTPSAGARAARRRAERRPEDEIDRDRGARRRGQAPGRAGSRQRWRRRASRTATSRSSSSTSDGSASSTASTAARTRRPTCCRSRSTRRGPAAGPRELGDVVICPEHTEDLAEAVVHGVLHLCGYDHETDDGEMLALQDRVMEPAL